jgi:hypothetical protein
MKRSHFPWCLALVALAWCAAVPALAQERSGRVKGSVKDPVETAFELPQGTQLTPAQAKALNKMRHDYEPQLREALEKMNSETDAKAKRLDAKDVLRTRQTIRGEIDQILNSGGVYQASPTAPATYESRYPTSSGTGEAPYNYYVPNAYPVYPYPYYPGVYPYYPRSYYYPPYTTATNTSQNKTTSTTRSTQGSTTRAPTTSTGGTRTTSTTKR